MSRTLLRLGTKTRPQNLARKADRRRGRWPPCRSAFSCPRTEGVVLRAIWLTNAISAGPFLQVGVSGTNAISAGPFLQVGVSGTGLAPGRGRDLGSVEAPPFLFAKQEKSLPQERREGRGGCPRRRFPVFSRLTQGSCLPLVPRVPHGAFGVDSRRQDVLGCIQVCVLRMAALQAIEVLLGLPVVCLGMAAFGTLLARVGRVLGQEFRAIPNGLVVELPPNLPKALVQNDPVNEFAGFSIGQDAVA